MGQMTLKEQLQEDLKTALRQKNSLKLNTIRSLKSVIKNKEIEIQKELEDEDVISLIVAQNYAPGFNKSLKKRVLRTQRI
jgi:uncharacterized protein